MSTLHQKQFIRAELTDWGQLLMQRLRAEILKMNIGDTDELVKSLFYEVLAASDNHEGKILIHFKEYGRFVDMGVGKAWKEGIVSNGQVLKGKVSRKPRKPKKFYSRTTYGMINRLISRISFNYQEQTVCVLKDGLTE